MTFVFSIPKCGTKLTEALINRLGLFGYSTHLPIRRNPLKPGDIRYEDGNRWASKRFNSQERNIILIRDPRDQLISFLRLHKMSAKDFDSLDLDSRLIEVLSIQDPAHYETNNFQAQSRLLLKEFYETAFRILQSENNNPNFLRKFRILKFEQIVGEKYGGIPESKRIKVLMNTFDLKAKGCSENKLKNALDYLSSGHTITYTKENQKVGQWRKYFKPFHIELFKKNWEKYLFAFGYESDPDWEKKYFPDYYNEHSLGKTA